MGHVFLALTAFLFLVAPSHGYTQLDDDALRAIPSGGDDFDIESGSLLAPILIPRVPGTEGSAKVQEHFVSFFRDNLPAWVVEWHNSTSKTPATGDEEIPFRNLIFRRDPPWAKIGDVARLTLVAHYDSMYKPDGFIGAIDSAAPCAMLMQIARGIDAALTQKWEAMQASGDHGMGLEEEVGVQIILLDGEEAWVRWSATDSVYGSRALAESWETETYPAASVFKHPIQSISLFVLLDLLGAKDPSVPSYFPTTHWAYRNMAKIEDRMRKLGILETQPDHMFLPDIDKEAREFGRVFIEDDHVPFMVRGVDILHVIPTPFPGVWHTMDDDGEHLDLPTVRDWARIATAFAAEWLEIGDYLPKKSEQEAEREVRSRQKTEL
ncbi:hypothetical protein ACRALDRAFT_1033525 [Sodiomyces alcalophilus JCM 7366]|uniref:uncharacterized protein n=1 Tax=Sodiomyces alcalophilus JCM 7366 TaxID=591952 RepID=UPI0039B619D5